MRRLYAAFVSVCASLGVVLSGLAGASASASIERRAIPACSSVHVSAMVRVGSGPAAQATRGAGLISATDRAMYVAVEKPAGNASLTQWAVAGKHGLPEALLSTWHGFVTASGAAIDPALLSQERIDAAATSLFLGRGVGDRAVEPYCKLDIRAVPLRLPDSSKRLIAIVAPGAGRHAEPWHYDAIGIGTGSRLKDVSLDFSTEYNPRTAMSYPAVRLVGYLELDGNADFTSERLVAFHSTDEKSPRLTLDPSTPADFDVYPPAGHAWREPGITLLGLTVGPGDADPCTGEAELRFPPPAASAITFKDPSGRSTADQQAAFSVRCDAGQITKFEWNATLKKPIKSAAVAPASPYESLGWIDWDRGKDFKLGVCPLLSNITVSVAPMPKGTQHYLSAVGFVRFDTKRRTTLDCEAAAKRAGATDPQDLLPVDADIDDVGISVTHGHTPHPVAHFNADRRTLDALTAAGGPSSHGLFLPTARDNSVRICSVAGEFVDDSAPAGRADSGLPSLPGIELTISEQFKANIVFAPTRPAAPAPLQTSDVRSNATATPPPCQNQPSSPSPLETPSPDSALRITMNVKGVTAFLPVGQYRNIIAPTHWENYSFENASVDLGNNKILGRDVESCSSAGSGTSTAPQTIATLNKIPLAARRLCIGVHLSPQHSSSDNDVAFGLLDICKKQVRDLTDDPEEQLRINASNEALACPPSIESTLQSAFAVTGFSAQLPTASPAKLRLGLASLTVNDFKIETVPEPPQFGDVVGVDRLNYLGCANLNVVGSASFGAINVPSSTPLVALTSDSDQNPFTVTPEIAMGQNCTVFSMQGFLPLHVTAQSLITITSLVFVSSKDVDNRDLFYFNAAGSITSGNVTGVFSSIGFRTKAKRQVGSPAVADTCSKHYHETQFGNLCVVSDINWPLSAGITAAQNSSQITQALTGIAGAVFGIAVRH